MMASHPPKPSDALLEDAKEVPLYGKQIEILPRI